MSKYITYKSLLDAGVNEVTVKNALKDNRNGRDSWQHERVQGNTSSVGKIMILLESIPPRTREKLSDTVPLYTKVGYEFLPVLAVPKPTAAAPSSIEEVQVSEIEAAIKAYSKQSDIDFFQRKKISLSKSKDFATAAAALRLLAAIRAIAEVKELHIINVDSKTDLEDAIMLHIPQLKVSNKRVLQRKVQKWKQDGLSSLTPKNASNQNAKIMTDAAQALIISLYAGWDGVKRTISGVHREYIDITEGKKDYVDIDTGEILPNNIPACSYETCKFILGQPYIKEGYARMRHGKKYANDFLRFWVHGKPLQYSLSLSSSDGWYLPFNKVINGVIVPKNKAKFVTYPIFDAKTGAILGISVGDKETHELMREAVHNMIETCMKHLGGAIPIENQLDNFGKGFKSELEKIFHTVHFCEPNRGQSKFAENLIGTVEDMICRNMQGWTGGNAGGSTLDFQVNEDLAKVGYEDGAKLTAQIVNDWNNMVLPSGKTRFEELKSCINPDAEQISPLQAAVMVGKQTILTVHNSGSFIHTYQNKEVAYYITNWSEIIKDFRRDYRIRVRFLPWDRSKVWVYFFDKEHEPDNDKFLCEAELIPLTARAKAEVTPEDKEALAVQIAHRHRTENARIAQEEEIKKFQILPIVQDIIDTEEDIEDLPAAEQLEVLKDYDNGQDKYKTNKHFKLKR